MEMAVAHAHAVGVGSVLSIQDSIAPDGMPWRWMVFQSRRWLKGNVPAERFRIYFPQSSNFGYREVSEWLRSPPVECLVFLRSVADPNSPYWVVAEHPDFPGAGVVRLSVGDTARQESSAARAIARLTPEELAWRSAIVVVGEARPTRARIRAYGKVISYTEVGVDSLLVGTVPPGPIRVYGLYGSLGVTGPVLLMLRPGESGAYEVVGATAGVLPIKNGAVEQLGESISSVAGRIRRAVSGRTPGQSDR
jgi:hypothetical protein